MDESASKKLDILQKSGGKLYFLSILIGIITGFVVSMYRLYLNYINHFREKYIELSKNDGKLLLLIWIIFVLTGMLVEYIGKKYPRISGSGIPQVKGIILGQLEYKNWFQELLGKFLTGLLGIGTGLSLGREGPSVQLGSYVAYGTGKIFKKSSTEVKYSVTSGASAGLAGAFGAPLSGVMFALEELHRFISTKLLICSFLASITSDFVGRRIFGINTAFDLIAVYPKNINPYYLFLSYIVLGIIVAFFGKIFIKALLIFQEKYKNLKISIFFKIVFVMSTAILLCYFLPDVTGGGHHLVEELTTQHSTISILIVIFIVKLIFTCLSYSTGFAGGIFLPMLVLGAILGKIYGIVLVEFFDMKSSFIIHYIVLGMAGYFVSVVRAPITGVILILEMTGNFDHLLALATVAIVSYYITEILEVEPIYEILYEKMPKDKVDIYKKHKNKTIMSIPISYESDLIGKAISDIKWTEDVLIVSIKRGEAEITPKGNVVIQGGDLLVAYLPEEKLSDIKSMLYVE